MPQMCTADGILVQGGGGRTSYRPRKGVTGVIRVTIFFNCLIIIDIYLVTPFNVDLCVWCNYTTRCNTLHTGDEGQVSLVRLGHMR